MPPVGALDESSTGDLRLYLGRYLAEGAEFYSLTEAAATENADIVLDGRGDRDVLTNQAVEAIIRQLSVHPGPPEWEGSPEHGSEGNQDNSERHRGLQD